MSSTESRSLLLIDSNLLLVLAVAAVDQQHVLRFKRTSSYSLEDVALLNQFVADYDGILVTPHILTEVSNLANQLTQPLLGQVRDVLAAFACQCAEHLEHSCDVAGDILFRKFGITDAGIRRASGRATTVLTDDLPLYATLVGHGVHAINFNHLRTAAWSG